MSAASTAGPSMLLHELMNDAGHRLINLTHVCEFNQEWFKRENTERHRERKTSEVVFKGVVLKNCLNHNFCNRAGVSGESVYPMEGGVGLVDGYTGLGSEFRRTEGMRRLLRVNESVRMSLKNNKLVGRRTPARRFAYYISKSTRSPSDRLLKLRLGLRRVQECPEQRLRPHSEARSTRSSALSK